VVKDAGVDLEPLSGDTEMRAVGHAGTPLSPALTMSTMAMLVQVELRSGTTVLTCWVEPKVKAGDQITLKNSDEPSRWWDVIRLGAQRDSSDIKRGWSNNI